MDSNLIWIGINKLNREQYIHSQNTTQICKIRRIAFSCVQFEFQRCVGANCSHWEKKPSNNMPNIICYYWIFWYTRKKKHLMRILFSLIANNRFASWLSKQQQSHLIFHFVSTTLNYISGSAGKKIPLHQNTFVLVLGTWRVYMKFETQSFAKVFCVLSEVDGFLFVCALPLKWI